MTSAVIIVLLASQQTLEETDEEDVET